MSESVVQLGPDDAVLKSLHVRHSGRAGIGGNERRAGRRAGGEVAGVDVEIFEGAGKIIPQRRFDAAADGVAGPRYRPATDRHVDAAGRRKGGGAPEVLEGSAAGHVK